MLNLCDLHAFLGVNFALEDLLRVKDLTFRNSGCAVWEHGTEGMLALLCKIVPKPRLAGCSDKGKGSSAYVSWCANKGMGWSGEVNEMINTSAGWAIPQPNLLTSYDAILQKYSFPQRKVRVWTNNWNFSNFSIKLKKFLTQPLVVWAPGGHEGRTQLKFDRPKTKFSSDLKMPFPFRIYEQLLSASKSFGELVLIPRPSRATLNSPKGPIQYLYIPALHQSQTWLTGDSHPSSRK